MIHRNVAVLTTIFAATMFTQAQAQTQQPSRFPPGAPNMFQGTPQEQAACRGDSVKFCREAMPDTFRVLSCLQVNRTRITTGCRKVLESHGQ